MDFPSWLRRSLPFAFALAAQAAAGPGFPPITFSAGELFKPIGTIHSPAGTSWGAGAMYRGYLVLGIDINEDSAGFQFWDLSNPRSPKLAAQKYDSESHKLREIQGYSFTTAYGRDYVAIPSHTGMEIWDFTDIQAVKRVSALKLAQGGGIGNYVGVISCFWQPPYIYCGSMNSGLFVVDATDPKAPRMVKQLANSNVNGKLVGGVFAVGNFLFMTTMQDQDPLGAISTFDITDPANPVLLDSYRGTVSGEGSYTSYMNGNKVYGHGSSGYLQVFDVSNPSDIRRLGQAGFAAERGGYGMFQDGFAHAGMSNTYIKYDVRGAVPTEAGRCAIPGDNDWVIALGNMAFIGDDDGPASTGVLMPHQAGPDQTGPSVNMSYPRQGAVNQPLSTRVGLTFSDNIDLASVGPAAFSVRPLGGAALPGKYSLMMGAAVLNFTPDAPLTPNTTYEAVIPAGGLKDWAGNGVPRDTVIRFSTGASVGLAPRAEGRAQPPRYGIFGAGAGPAAAFSAGGGAWLWIDPAGRLRASLPARPGGHGVAPAPGFYALLPKGR